MSRTTNRTQAGALNSAVVRETLFQEWDSGEVIEQPWGTARGEAGGYLRHEAGYDMEEEEEEE
ncbi:MULTISPECIES: hypothetical protein [Pseudomonas]|uniref:Uncharacterized protein n=1 Tax=Pseudomonas eucalypticola TaxID=2599595 RepID=A0A7D5H4Y2_9PSED|nr:MULTISPECIES: hypothetical protein [Pseudomonas]QKZ03064.1 hypothetical protein HWQ56_04345 [Pseudomonas eucalypticola]